MGNDIGRIQQEIYELQLEQVNNNLSMLQLQVDIQTDYIKLLLVCAAVMTVIMMIVFVILLGVILTKDQD